jgi:hypothetical protein
MCRATTLHLLLDFCDANISDDLSNTALEVVFANYSDPKDCYDGVVCTTRTPHALLVDHVIHLQDEVLLDHAVRHIHDVWLGLDEDDREFDVRWLIMAVLAENEDATASWVNLWNEYTLSKPFGIATIHAACRVAGMGYDLPLADILEEGGAEDIDADGKNGLWVRGAPFFSF